MHLFSDSGEERNSGRGGGGGAEGGASQKSAELEYHLTAASCPTKSILMKTDPWPGIASGAMPKNILGEGLRFSAK